MFWCCFWFGKKELEEAVKRVEVEYVLENLIGQVERNEQERTDMQQKEETQQIILEKANLEKDLVV